jgi:hypothetical protein
MEECCRICRKSISFISFLIDSYHDGIPISEMLLKTCPIDITTDDPIGLLLPKSICDDCLEVISAAYNLQRVCVESDQYFRSLISNDQIIVKNEKFEDEPEIKLEEWDMQEDNEDEEYQRTVSDEDYEPTTYLIPVTKKRKYEKVAATKFNPRLTLNPLNSVPMYECNFCLIQFKPRQSIMKHMKLEHDPIILPYGCDFCSARFKSEDKKCLHENIRHAGEVASVIMCEICGINGISEEGMRNHLVDDHKMSQDKMDLDEVNKIRKTSTVFNPRPFNKAAK